MHYIVFGSQTRGYTDISQQVKDMREISKRALCIRFFETAQAGSLLELLKGQSDCILLYSPEGRRAGLIKMTYTLTGGSDHFHKGTLEVFVHFSRTTAGVFKARIHAGQHLQHKVAIHQ